MDKKDYLIAAYRVHAQYIHDHSPYKLINRLFSLKSITNDRWGWLTQYSNINWLPLNEKPTNFNQNTNISDIIDDRAVDIIKQAAGREIITCWSGGVDSCCIVASLIKNNVCNRLSVILTQHSIEENPDFYHFMLSKGIRPCLVQYDTFYNHLYDRNDYILVHGHCCDELFHSNIPMWLSTNELATNWKDIVTTFLKRNHNASQHSIDKFDSSFEIIDQYTNNVLYKPITSFADFMWFWKYVGRYDFTRHVVTLETDNQYLCDNNVAFFDTPQFNLWALQNFWFDQSHNPTTATYYKMPLKQYIHRAINDSMCDRLVKRCSYDNVYQCDQRVLNFHILTPNGVKNIPITNQKEKFDYIKSRFYKKYSNF